MNNRPKPPYSLVRFDDDSFCVLKSKRIKCTSKNECIVTYLGGAKYKAALIESSDSFDYLNNLQEELKKKSDKTPEPLKTDQLSDVSNEKNQSGLNVEFNPISSSSPNLKTDNIQINKSNKQAIDLSSTNKNVLDATTADMTYDNSDSSPAVSGFTEELSKLGSHWPDSLNDSYRGSNDMSHQVIDESTDRSKADHIYLPSIQEKDLEVNSSDNLNDLPIIDNSLEISWTKYDIINLPLTENSINSDLETNVSLIFSNNKVGSGTSAEKENINSYDNCKIQETVISPINCLDINPNTIKLSNQTSNLNINNITYDPTFSESDIGHSKNVDSMDDIPIIFTDLINEARTSANTKKISSNGENKNHEKKLNPTSCPLADSDTVESLDNTDNLNSQDSTYDPSATVNETENTLETLNESANPEPLPISKKSIDLTKIVIPLSGKQTEISKKHFCIYCKQLKTKFADHIFRVHSNEEEVKNIMFMKKGSLLRKQKIAAIRARGDHLHNTNPDFNTNIFILPRRNSKN
ncbi:uncharacterized protein LOC141535869 [Cotesia typhae]|uniref:uncharacterized protein LOC141535869 n=1 Tax=Cotesia typhae TaxID=2053667 RepID=UPI003D680C9E